MGGFGLSRLQNGYNPGRLSGLQIDPANPTDIHRWQPSDSCWRAPSIQITVDVYGHLEPGRNRQAVNKLPTEKGVSTEALDGRVGIDFWSAGTLGRVGVPPAGDGVLIEPKGQATPGDQRPIVVWPVAYSVPERVLIRRHSSCWHPGPSETSRHAEAIYATTRFELPIHYTGEYDDHEGSP